jgi:hypothetical protein
VRAVVKVQKWVVESRKNIATVPFNFKYNGQVIENLSDTNRMVLLGLAFTLSFFDYLRLWLVPWYANRLQNLLRFFANWFCARCFVCKLRETQIRNNEFLRSSSKNA